MTKERALGLAEIGLHVFPCRATWETVQTKDGPVEMAPKSPYTRDGFLDATTDANKINFWWDEHPAALVGVWAGASGLVVLDIDVKRDDNGDITVDGFDDLDSAWLDVPDTFAYSSVNGEGKHLVYADPGNVEGLTPKTKYRGMRGIDRRSGGSYVVWAGEVPESRDVFKECPEWFLDASEVRSADAFKGDVKDWFDTLTPGEPNVLVRRAIDRVDPDMTHQDMVSAQYEAVRLGAEGNPGVPHLLSALEDAWLNRPAYNHTTPEGQWEYKFAEALASGIKEYGGEIALVRDMPEYSLALVPSEVPDRLISGPPGDKATFNHLLREMTDREADDLKVLSVMWNVPTVRELSREWGLMFTMKRIQEARLKPPPVKENPSLEKTSSRPTDGLLTDDERQYAIDHPTFIDDYIEASAQKGFVNLDYAIPAAWTMLSMAFGGRAFIPKGVKLGMNLWFNILGYSGTGKTSEDDFLKACLDLMLKDGQTYYNLGANSSPEAIHEALLERDKKASMVHHDEASDFFDNLRRKDWMATLKDLMAKWYSGYVDPMQKVRLKDQRGKSAITSFNITMFATPDRLLGLVDTSMFETGFLARFNWVWGAPPVNEDHKYDVSRSTVDDEGINPMAYELVADLLHALRGLPVTKPVAIDWTEMAMERLVEAHKEMDRQAKERDYYTATEPAVTRLGRDTIWKCAALLALYRGERVIRYQDAITAIYYAERWFHDLFRVVGAAGEGDFNRDANEIEAYIRSYPAGVTQASVYYRFRKMIDKSKRELDDRIDFLLASGRILRDSASTDAIRYKTNGGGE